VSQLSKLRSKFLTEKTRERKLQESRSNFVGKNPTHIPPHFNQWIAGRNRTNHKAHLYVQPYRPPAYLTAAPVDPEKEHKKSRRSSSNLSSIFPIPAPVVQGLLRGTTPSLSIPPPRSSSEFWKPIKFLGPPEDSFAKDPPASAVESTIKKSRIPRGKKLRTKWHCSICSLRHLSSEKQLLDHQGSFRCQARQNRDNPFRCRKCGKKCDNAENYHRHKEARCYKNISK